jgi:hypothetical protein
MHATNFMESVTRHFDQSGGYWLVGSIVVCMLIAIVINPVLP